MNKGRRSSIGVFNPNQRQFIEDESLYRHKLEQLHVGAGKSYIVRERTFNKMVIFD